MVGYHTYLLGYSCGRLGMVTTGTHLYRCRGGQLDWTARTNHLLERCREWPTLVIANTHLFGCRGGQLSVVVSDTYLLVSSPSCKIPLGIAYMMVCTMFLIV